MFETLMLVPMAKASEWSERVAAWQASGLCAREFCNEHGYSVKLLQWWSSHLRRQGKASSRAGKGVALAKVVRAASSVVASRSSPILVRFERACVEVPVGADLATLGVVFEALRAGGSR